MEPVVDRIIEILRADLPEQIANSNAANLTEDLAKFGESLALTEPDDYIYGPVSNLENTLQLQVYSDESVNTSETFSESGLRKATFYIDFVYTCDDKEITNRITDRYRYAIEYVLAQKLFLPNPITGRGEYAKSGKILSNSKKLIVFKANPLFTLVKIKIECEFSIAFIDNLMGFK